MQRPLRHFLPCLLLLCSVVPAGAQPSFIVVDRKPVGRGPIFVTTGDFNPGSPRGIAVSSFWVDEVTFYPTSDGGLLGEPTTLTLGRNLRDLTSFDLDGDSFGDLIVGDEAGGARNARLFTLLGNGGDFQPPGEVLVESPVIQNLRTGNFDGESPRDIATPNGRFGTVSILYGRGGQLVPASNVFLAGSVTDVAALDIDGDGLDDLVVLTEGEGEVSTVTALHSLAVGFALLVPSTELGLSRLKMARGDYDGDGIRDLAVIAAGPGLTKYSIDVLLTRRPPPPSGSPLFTVQSQTFDCPPVRGAPGRCELIDVVSADFDRNNVSDLAISMPDPGVVAILARQVGGNFALPTYMTTAGSPRGLAVGDVSGDGVEDLVITEFDTDSVVVAVSSVPPRGELGEACSEGIECESGACVDAVCCAEPQCAPSERCDITGHRGTCTRPLPAGSQCDKNADCQSAMCTAAAPENGVCLPGDTGDSCLGDCNDDGEATVDEILVAIQIALGEQDVGACVAADGSGDGTITVDEIVGTVGSALDGCPLP